jgi:drug/metabolite transporter (DMT)-like permease
MFLIVFMYAVLAATFTIAKTVLVYAKPFFTIGFRMTVAGIIFLLFQFFRNKKKFVFRKNDVWLFLQVILFNIYFAFIPEFWALSRGISSSKAVFMYSCTPFIVAVFAYFFAAEKFHAKKIIGMIIGFSGMIPILITHDSIGNVAREVFKISLPELVLLVAIISAAYGWFPVKKLMKKGYSLPMINGVSMSIGGILAFITSFLFEGFSFSIANIPSFLFYIFLLILASNVVFYNLYGFLLKRYSFTFLSFTGFLTPIFGAIYGKLFLKESVTWHYGISLCSVIVGLYLFYQEELSANKR